MNSLNSVRQFLNPAKLQQVKPSKAWCHPVYSPEHGAYIALLVAFLTGAAAAREWSWATTWASICAFLGFQAEHPLRLQIRQRKTLKPRLLFWGGVYAMASSAIAVYLYFGSPAVAWIYGGALLVLAIDAIAIFHRQQRSIWNEWLTFAAVCLSAPFAYAATVGALSPTVVGIWGINALFFGGSVFTLKLRKLKTMSGTVGKCLSFDGSFGRYWLVLLAARAAIRGSYNGDFID